MGSPMILCHCHVVSDRAVANAVLDGARTLAGVCRSTGAGRDCGACVFSVRKAVAEVVEVLEMAPADCESVLA
jgi:bacterioferritin-associated ferredoxin